MTGRRNDCESRSSLSSGYFLRTLRDNPSVPSSGVLDSWSLKMGPISCPETSVRDCHYSLRNNPEKRTTDAWNHASNDWLNFRDIGHFPKGPCAENLLEKTWWQFFCHSVSLHVCFRHEHSRKFWKLWSKFKITLYIHSARETGPSSFKLFECQTRFRGRRQALHFIFSVQSVTSARAVSRGSNGIGIKTSSLPHPHNFLTIF